MDARGVLDLLDLTLLDHNASEADLDALCERANEHRPAAVCVFSEHITHVRSRLDDSIPVAAVAAGFPLGESDPAAASEAIRAAVQAGADEIDCVLEPREAEDFPHEPELAMLIAMREASAGRVLKVIIETPMLDERSMRATARMALAAGADFVKSCTGKRGGCSDEAAEIDCGLEPREAEDFPHEPELAMLIAMREASAGRVLKVIIETPMLDERSMRATARMALAAGADFVKSCTGKRGGCSDEAAEILAFEVMRHGITMGSHPGVKLSGGISTLDDVERLLGLVNSEDPTIEGAGRLRIGASSLLNELIG